MLTITDTETGAVLAQGDGDRFAERMARQHFGRSNPKVPKTWTVKKCRRGLSTPHSSSLLILPKNPPAVKCKVCGWTICYSYVSIKHRAEEYYQSNTGFCITCYLKHRK